MADISKEIQDFRKAKKGKDVKGSMISLAEKVNREATDASQAAANSSASAGAAASNAQLAVNRADTAAQNANQAAQNIQDKADAGYFTGTVQIGTVTTGEPGSEASVSNSGTDKDAVLDITIPRGNQGISFRMRKAWEPEVDYVNDTSYIDIVSYDGGTYGCLTSHRSSELVTPANTAYWQCLAKKGETGSIDNIDDVKIDFAKAENRVNISPEDTLAIILGKVEKIYADLKAVAFSGKYSDLTGTLQNVSDLENDAGYVTENTWKANTASSEGYVAASQGQANMIWGTDAEGNPGWQDGVEIDEMAGATAEAAGAAGIVPAPAAGMQGAFLRGDATWGQLGAGAFAESANNLATTQEGFLLDARQGKELADQISLVNSAKDIEIIVGNNIGAVRNYCYIKNDILYLNAQAEVIGNLVRYQAIITFPGYKATRTAISIGGTPDGKVAQIYCERDTNKILINTVNGIAVNDWILMNFCIPVTKDIS